MTIFGILVTERLRVLNGLDLFSGIGGITKALMPWVSPIAYCECDRYAQAVLLSRQADRELPYAPIWDDVRTLRAADLPVAPQIVYGGFPCQDISTAGRGKGLEGERSGLYWELHRIVRECEPTYVFLENVPAIATRGGCTVVRSLTELGYDCRWTVLSAADVGAPHLRKRWWLLAHAKRKQLRNEPGGGCRQNGTSAAESRNDGPQKPMADTKSIGKREPANETDAEPACGKTRDESRSGRTATDSHGEPLGRASESRCERGFWEVEPDVGRVADGVPARVDRLTGLGNAVVPACAREAFRRLMGLENDFRDSRDSEGK